MKVASDSATASPQQSPRRAAAPLPPPPPHDGRLLQRVRELEGQCRALQASEASARVELSREIQAHEDLKTVLRHRSYIEMNDVAHHATTRQLHFLEEELLQTTLQLEAAKCASANSY